MRPIWKSCDGLNDALSLRRQKLKGRRLDLRVVLAAVGGVGRVARSVIHSCEEKGNYQRTRLTLLMHGDAGGGWEDGGGVLILALLIVPGVEAREEEVGK